MNFIVGGSIGQVSAGRYVDWLVVGLLAIAVLWVILRTEYRGRQAKRSARRKGARPSR
jgi:hypothetical protein